MIPMRAWALLVCCACGRLGFDGTSRIGPDATVSDGTPLVDAVPDGALDPTCVAPGAGTTFPGGAPCADWGGTPSVIDATITESGGQLVITPSANTAGAQGGCVRSAVPFGAGGAIVEVSSVLAGANTLTAFQLGLGATALSMAVSGGMLLSQDGTGTRASVAYDPVKMRYWRVRPTTAQIVFEYGDGTSWTQHGSSSQTPLASYDFQILAGELAAAPAPGSARIESVNLCP